MKCKIIHESRGRLRVHLECARMSLDGGLTPVGALPYLVDALRGGYADCFWREGDSTVVRLIPEDSMTVTVWLEEESMTPVYAELASGERVTVFCEIEDWELGTSSA